MWNFSDKKSLIFFTFLLKNIDCGYSLEPPRRGGSNEYHTLFLSRGGSNEYLQSMFSSRNKKKMHTPVNPSFTI